MMDNMGKSRCRHRWRKGELSGFGVPCPFDGRNGIGIIGAPIIKMDK